MTLPTARAVVRYESAEDLCSTNTALVSQELRAHGEPKRHRRIAVHVYANWSSVRHPFLLTICSEARIEYSKLCLAT